MQAPATSGQGSVSDVRLFHGGVFLLVMAVGLIVPVLRTWPWIWLAPLLGYAFFVAVTPSLRSSISWLHVGRCSRKTMGVTFLIVAGTSLVLIAFSIVMHPEVREVREAVPFTALGGPILAGAIFAVTNAVLEESVFRGVLFDALQSQWGAQGALISSSLLFSFGHLHGYPPGYAGALLAAVFGGLMAWLRLWTGGLGLPILAHIAADATIYWIVIHS